MGGVGFPPFLKGGADVFGLAGGTQLPHQGQRWLHMLEQGSVVETPLERHPVVPCWPLHVVQMAADKVRLDGFQPLLVIQQAQEAMEKVPGFAGNVKAVRTDVLVDKAAEELYPTWKQNFEEWQKTGSDHAYHYLGSAIWHLRMGGAFAEAMLEMTE